MSDPIRVPAAVPFGPVPAPIVGSAPQPNPPPLKPHGDAPKRAVDPSREHLAYEGTTGGKGVFDVGPGGRWPHGATGTTGPSGPTGPTRYRGATGK